VASAEVQSLFGRASKRIRPFVSRRVNRFLPRVRHGPGEHGSRDKCVQFIEI